MAEVFKAKSFGVEGFEKILVIKRIRENLTKSEKFVDMFINEAKICVTLNHANIVQVFDLGKMEDSYFIAMEYVQGYDLATVNRFLVGSGDRLPLELGVFIISEVCKGLDYAHRRRDQNMNPVNIVHRDISPHNVLLSMEGEVKITDFGIAKAKTLLEENEHNVIKGKYAYMAPEQAQALDVDRRADIFSCGVVLYELLAGTNPLRGSDSVEIVRRAQDSDHPPLHEVAADVPEELAEIVRHAMAARSEDRYQSAARMYEDLMAFLFTTGRRVGSHDLARFMDDLHRELGAPGPQADVGRAIADAVGGEEASSVSEISYRSEEEITSVQVKLPSQMPAADDEATITTTTRTLTAQKREVTGIAVEFMAPEIPDKVRKNIEEIMISDGGHLVENQRDFIVGLFGIKIADGRDTEKAARCAIKIQKSLEIMDQPDELINGIGTGIHPGQVVLLEGKKVREDEAYFEFISSMRDLASRGAGCITASARARRLSEKYFRFESMERLTGEEEKLYRLIESRSQRELYGRFTGRKEELKKIGEILADVNTGHYRVLALKGDAGIGKTRLLHEVNERMAKTGHPYAWYEATIPVSGRIVPYQGASVMLRRILALEEIENVDRIRQSVNRLRELGLSQEEIDSCGVVLGLTTGDSVGPEERGRYLLSGMSKILTRLSRDRLSIFIWDGADSLDSESVNLIEELASGFDSGRMLLTVVYRESFSSRIQKLPVTARIALVPLNENDTAKMSLDRLGAKKASKNLLGEIVSKSGGNPLFIEEYIMALEEARQIEKKRGRISWHPERGRIEMPRTLRGLFSTRVEHLSTDQLGILQRASIIGLHFDLGLLAEVSGTGTDALKTQLSDLMSRGILIRISAEEYAFASDTIREVILDGILASDYESIHLSIAKAIEKLFAERLEKYYARLAAHYREAGEMIKAADYFIHAGDRVAAQYSHRVALEYYLEGLTIMEGLPNTDRARILGLCRTIATMSINMASIKTGLDIVEKGISISEELDDAHSLVSLYTLKGQLLVRDDHFSDAKLFFQSGLDLADDFADPAMRRDILSAIGELYLKYGDFHQAISMLEEAVTLCVATGDTAAHIQTLCTLSEGSAVAGMAEEGRKYLEEAEKLSMDYPDPMLRVRVVKAAAMGAYMQKNYGEALAASQRLREMSAEYGFALEESIAAHNMGDIYLNQGDYKRAYTFLRLSLDICREKRFSSLEMITEILLSYIDALKFESEEGLRKLEKTLEDAEETGTIWEHVQAHYFLGRIYYERGKEDVAMQHLEEVIRIGDESGNRIYDKKARELLRAMGNENP